MGFRGFVPVCLSILERRWRDHRTTDKCGECEWLGKSRHDVSRNAGSRLGERVPGDDPTKWNRVPEPNQHAWHYDLRSGELGHPSLLAENCEAQEYLSSLSIGGRD